MFSFVKISKEERGNDFGGGCVKVKPNSHVGNGGNLGRSNSKAKLYLSFKLMLWENSSFGQEVAL